MVANEKTEQVWRQVFARVESRVLDQVWDRVRAQVLGQVKVPVWDQVDTHVNAQVRDQILRLKGEVHLDINRSIQNLNDNR